jgi:hypothetical protein
VSATRQFVLMVNVSEEFLRKEPDRARAAARELLAKMAHEEPLMGPRGGRYLAINEPHSFWETYVEDAYARGQKTMTALVTGVYIRPRRTA